MRKILVTGAFGLVGTELLEALQKKYGKENVVATDIRIPESFEGISEKLDVINKESILEIAKRYDIGTFYHLAGILSVGGEKNPDLAWDVNLNGLKNVLDIAVSQKAKVFWPSSIAAFGPTTPQENTPQHTILEPTTIYGVTKVTGELLCQYYFNRYGVDVRSLRYPGLNGWKAEPGDGTTEYAIHIFYAAIKTGKYVCPLRPDTRLPMMYLEDAINGTIQLMEADQSRLTIRTSYNFSGISFTPEELVEEIKKIMPEFEVVYQPNQTQAIADSWPKTIDDSDAKKDWDWKPEYDLTKMTEALMKNIRIKLGTAS